MHHRIVVGFTLFGSALTVGLVTPGCGWILGLDEFVDAPPDTGGTGGTGGEGGGCEPSTPVACYEGPDGTEGVGQCVAGSQACGPDGIPAGTCEGQVLPAAETCANPADEDCDGHDCVIWAKMFGDVSDQGIGGMAVAPDGSIYVAGKFNGTLAFDPQAPMSATNAMSIYIAKLSPQGEPIWSKSFHGSYVNAKGVSSDTAGNVIMTGQFRGSMSFGGATHTATGPQTFATYITKFTASGELAWSEMHENAEDDNYITRPAIDSSGAVVVFGAGRCMETCGSPNERLWMRKYYADGSLAWFKNFPWSDSGGERVAGAIAVDSADNILATGSFGGPGGSPTTDFGGAPLTTHGGADTFVVKFNPDGEVMWQRSYGGNDDDIGMDIAAVADSVVVLGTFAGTMPIDNTSLTSAGMTDIFAVKLDSAGTKRWAKSFGSSGTEDARSVGIDPDGGVVAAGETNGAIDLGGGALDAGGGKDLALAKLAPDGAHVWSKLFGDDVDQTAPYITIAPGGDVLLAGSVAGSVDLGAGEMFSTGGSDALIARFAR